MRPALNLLTSETVQKIIDEGFALLENPGIEFHNQDTLELLLAAGAEADLDSQIVRIPEIIARGAFNPAHRFSPGMQISEQVLPIFPIPETAPNAVFICWISIPLFTLPKYFHLC
jgi:trimethylamine:corrinoid methyltransferase-like protein